jgi:hypothetical protein
MQELAGQAAAGPGIDPYQMPDGSTGYWVPGLGRFSFQSGENTVTDITVGGSAGEAPPEAALGVAGVIANQLFDAQFASQTA